MKVMSSLPEQTSDLSLDDLRLKRFFIIFMAERKTDDGEVAEEEEELDEAEDMSEEVDGDSFEGPFPLDTSSFDLVLLATDLRLFKPSNLFIGPVLLDDVVPAFGRVSN